MNQTKKKFITNADTERKLDTSLKKLENVTNTEKALLKKEKEKENIIAEKPRASLRKKEERKERKEDTNAELPRDTS